MFSVLNCIQILCDIILYIRRGVSCFVYILFFVTKDLSYDLIFYVGKPRHTRCMHNSDSLYRGL